MRIQSQRFRVVLSLLVCIASACAQKYPIVKLTASGSERYLAEDILRFTGLAEDKSIDVPLTAVQAAAEKLNASGAFSEVKYKHTIAPGGMKVEFTLVDKDDDQFVPCEFENIVWLPEADLAPELHNRVSLFNGAVPREGAMADDVIAALQSLLKQRGVATNVVSTVQEPTNSGSKETIVFRAVDVEVKVARVSIPGASPALAPELDTEGKRLIGLSYNRGTLNKFIDKNLRSVYLKRGFLRAAFAPPVIEVLPAASSNTNQAEVVISIPVTEGIPYKLVRVQWSGYKAVPAEDLQQTLKPSLGQIVDGTALRKGESAVRTLYGRLGYLHMLLTSEPTFDEATSTVNYHYTVKEGDLFRMGKLEIEGLQPAAAAKVHFAWKLREGDPFDASYVRKFFLSELKVANNSPFVVEESEGERAKTLDLTVIFCTPNQPCRPTTENHLNSAQDAEQEIKP